MPISDILPLLSSFDRQQHLSIPARATISFRRHSESGRWDIARPSEKTEIIRQPSLGVNNGIRLIRGDRAREFIRDHRVDLGERLDE